MRTAVWGTTMMLCLGLFLVAARADTLSMPKASGGSSSAAEQGASRPNMPKRGLTMREVRERYGAPERRIPPVGDPPITRWVYPGYIVYFEKQYVIHSVDTRDQPRPQSRH